MPDDETPLDLQPPPTDEDVWRSEPDLCPVHRGEKPCLYHPCEPDAKPIPAVPRFER